MKNSQTPTPEQQKVLWEWCGFKYLGKAINYNYGDGVEQDLWEWPGGLEYFAIPGINSLDNLFKYAVPKLYEQDYYYDLLQWNNGRHKAIINKGTAGWAVTASDAVAETPALALFWAINSAIKGR